MVETTIQEAEVSVETVEDVFVLRVKVERQRWNICLTEDQANYVIEELNFARS